MYHLILWIATKRIIRYNQKANRCVEWEFLWQMIDSNSQRRLEERNTGIKTRWNKKKIGCKVVELKRFLTRVKEKSEKAGLKLNIQKTKIMASSPITSRQINGKKMEIVTDFIFLGFKITADGDCSHGIKRRLLLERTEH